MPLSSAESSLSRPGSGFSSPAQRGTRSRTHSFSSDRPSTVSHSIMSPPASVSPEAGFIAAAAASQIVTNDHDNHADTWYDQHGVEPSGETALVSPGALLLVNNFLDQLLFSFLSVARSTSLHALRTSVTEVLKPKLAKDAISQADEELKEYLGGGEDDDMLQSSAPETPANWDLELVWKRTRLRCMVYSSLGDLEEEDEDFYMEQEHLEGGDESLGETVSPAVAIFLTSILEFMGEQSLISAGQAAFHRMRYIYQKERKEAAPSDPAPVADRITVEEIDMERVAFDRTIGKLWRAWKKRIRSPATDTHSFQLRSLSIDAGRGYHTRQTSQGTVDSTTVPETVDERAEHRDRSVLNRLSRVTEPHSPFEKVDVEQEWLKTAASVPLPLADRDVAEILVPGFASRQYSDDEDVADDEFSGRDSKGRKKGKKQEAKDQRPHSLMILPVASTAGLPTPTMSEPRTPDTHGPRKRANSLPTPSTSPISPPPTKRAKGAGAGGTFTPPAEVEDRELPADDREQKRVTSKPKRRKGAALAAGVIGAAITTISPRAVHLASDEAKRDLDISDGEADNEIDEFTEEPEILTSSRVSISGRSSSPASSEHGRPVSFTNGGLARPASTHSLRVIDVAGPRSPVTRSRTSSAEAAEYASVSPPTRVQNVSRNSSGSTPPIVEEGYDSPDDMSTDSRSSYMSAKTSRNYARESMSEAEEVSAMPGGTRRSRNASYPASEELPSPNRYTDAQPHAHHPYHGAAASAASSTYDSIATPTSQSPMMPPPLPVASNMSAPTKVTILNSSTTDGSFYDSKPEVPAKSPTREAAQLPNVTPPERSARRSVGLGITAAAAAVSAAAVAATTHSSNTLSPLPPSRSAGRSSPNVSREQQSRFDQQANMRTPTPVITKFEAQPALEPTSAQSQTPALSTSSSASKLKPKRASEDSSAIRPEDVARNFEQLIQSDQTIQYTLTPESMRDIDSSRSINDGSSIRPSKSRKSEDTRQQSDRSRSSSVNKRSSDVKRTPSGSLAAEPPTKTNGRLKGPIPRSPHGVTPSVSSSSSKRNGPQARDARVPRESLADFAEFIRATGPSAEQEPTPLIPNGTGSGGRNFSSPAALQKNRASVSRGSTRAGYRRFQAREAAVDYKDDNSDLIDFIRRGPPSNSSENPRMPRHGAPVRSTMDSDQMAGAVVGRAVDSNISSVRYSAASTNITESSMNSSSALIKKDKSSPKIGSSSGNMFDDSDMMPKRKTRRVKDPYAIDFSDEEDEDAYSDTPRGPSNGASSGRPTTNARAGKEESLVDFLNSCPPPVESNPVLFDIPQTRNLRLSPKKKGSAPSLMARLGGRSSSSGSNLGSGSNTSPPAQAAPQFKSNSTNSRTNGRALDSRAGSTTSGRGRGYIPIEVNIPPGYDKYGTTSATPGPKRPVAGSSGRVPMKKYEPREAQPTTSGTTQDLAAFFRNSGPGERTRG